MTGMTFQSGFYLLVTLNILSIVIAISVIGIQYGGLLAYASSASSALSSFEIAPDLEIPLIETLNGDDNFSDYQSVLGGCYVSICLGLVIILDIFMTQYVYIDLKLDANTLSTLMGHSFVAYDKLLHSTMMVSSVAIIVASSMNSYTVDIFCAVHVLQFLTTNATVLHLLNYSYPKIFTDMTCLAISLTLLMGVVTSIIGIGRSHLFWANIISYTSLISSPVIAMSALVILFRTWNLTTLSLYRPFDSNNSFKDQKAAIYIFFYLMSGFVTLICWARHGGSWLQLDVIDVNIFIYSMAIFGYGVSTIPTMFLKRTLLHAAVKSAQADIKGTIIRYLSHEMRTPLMIITSTLENMLEDAKCGDVLDPCDVVSNLSNTIHASKAAVLILNDVLSYESIDAGKFKLTQEMMLIHSACEDMAKRCVAFGLSKKISISFVNNLHSQASSSLHCFIDLPKLEQCLRNLLVNAVKFTPVNGNITVYLGMEAKPVCSSELDDKPQKSSSESSDHIRNKVSRIHPVVATKDNRQGWADSNYFVSIKVTDNGCGIAPSDIHKVFGQFVQFDANTLQGGGGSGLGLWICHEIINAHGGRISVSSDGLTLGTTVSILLDSYTSDTEMVSMLRSKQKQVGDSLHLDFGRMLVTEATDSVDDHRAEMTFGDIRKSATSDSPQISTTGPTGTSVASMDMKASNGPPFQFLVVDDSPMCRKVLSEGIRRVLTNTMNITNFNITQAADGLEAINLIQASCSCAGSGNSNTETSSFLFAAPQFDLVFIDNVMTEMDGLPATKIIRGMGFSGKIIGVTGNVIKSDIDAFIEAGADLVLAKPVEKSSLAQLLKKCVGDRGSLGVNHFTGSTFQAGGSFLIGYDA